MIEVKLTRTGWGLIEAGLEAGIKAADDLIAYYEEQLRLSPEKTWVQVGLEETRGLQRLWQEVQGDLRNQLIPGDARPALGLDGPTPETTAAPVSVGGIDPRPARKTRRGLHDQSDGRVR